MNTATSTTTLSSAGNRHATQSRFAQNVLSFMTGLFASPAARTATESASLEAQKVRSLAAGYSKTDPGFAADLYAAAARHEGLYAE